MIGKDWDQAFIAKLARNRVPISVTLELTRRCNLRCIHCYLGSQEKLRESHPPEMTTSEVCSVIDQTVDAGCLYLLITGGDPMMRKDFPEVYRHARESGLVVTVFTDGVLVTDEIIELFREFPPQLVEASLYGSTAETYEKVTRVKGSFARCLRGVDRLLDAGIAVGLKTVLMTVNQHELDAMRSMADERGVGFRVDAAIFPCLSDGGCDPLALRVDPVVGAEGELGSAKALDDLRRYAAERADMPPADRTYVCGAGVTGFSVDPYGWASPCLLATHVKANLLERGLEDVWNHELKAIRDRKPRLDYECSSCEMRAVCSVCPAVNFLETGEEDRRSDYVCAAAAARWKMINDNSRGVGCAGSTDAAAETVGEGSTA